MQKFLDFDTNLASQEGLCNMDLVNCMSLQKIVMKYTNQNIIHQRSGYDLNAGVHKQNDLHLP